MMRVRDVVDHWQITKIKSSPEELWIVAMLVAGAEEVLGKRRKPFLKFKIASQVIKKMVKWIYTESIRLCVKLDESSNDNNFECAKM